MFGVQACFLCQISTKAKQSKAKQSNAKQSKAKQRNATQSKAKQSKAKQSKAFINFSPVVQANPEWIPDDLEEETAFSVNAVQGIYWMVGFRGCRGVYKKAADGDVTGIGDLFLVFSESDNGWYITEDRSHPVIHFHTSTHTETSLLGL